MLRGFLKTLETVSTFFKYSIWFVTTNLTHKNFCFTEKSTQTSKQMLADTDSIYK